MPPPTSVRWAFVVLVFGTHCTPRPAAPTAEPPSSPPILPAVAQTPRAVRPDGDRDGVADADDACADLPEDPDGFEDADGCPDRDNDNDGVPDAHEWTGERWTNCDRKIRSGRERDCRDVPENIDGYRDQDGCPDELEEPCTAAVSVSLHYDARTLRFRDEELAGLSAIFDHAAEYPHESFDVAGHANRGRDPLGARRRSQRASERIRDELVRRGLPAARIRAYGLGHPREFGKPEDDRVVVFMHYTGAGPVSCL